MPLFTKVPSNTVYSEVGMQAPTYPFLNSTTAPYAGVLEGASALLCYPQVIGESRRSEDAMRYMGLIVGILWIILMVGIVLVFLNTPGIR
jgi:hypothetical protein